MNEASRFSRIHLGRIGGSRRILIAGGGLGYFEDNDVKRVVASRAGAKVYYVSVVNGKVAERVFEPELIS